MISGQDIMSLLPMVILAGGMILTMLLVALVRNHILAFVSTLVVLSASFISIFFIPAENPHCIGEIFIVDAFGMYYQALVLGAAFVIAIFSYISLKNLFPDKRKEEYYLLLMIATLGSAMMVISSHFISFFVSLEILTVSLYALVGYYREREKAIEAGLKYLILAAMSSSFLIFGMGLIYAISGTLSFSDLSAVTHSMERVETMMLIAGAGMMVAGFGFKLALVPFHMWASDVYEGASSPVSAFIATVSKGGTAAILLRFFLVADIYRYHNVMMAFVVISILSMLIGNLLALLQNNVKRILAYSSIANFGYLLLGFIAGKETGLHAFTFFITGYIVTILGAFGIITLISESDGEAADIENYKGLFWRRPFLASAFTVFLLSLAGIPLTAGFIGKYFLLNAALGKSQWALAIVLAISSVIGLYYYLRIIVSMMAQDRGYEVTAKPILSSIAGVVIITGLIAIVILLGVCPVWLIDTVNRLAVR
jgi:NADH-quinone oxidoreductase subunit N